MSFPIVLVRSALLVVFLHALVMTRADVQAVTQEAQRLINEEQAGAALAVLEPATQAYAGNPSFDYVLALALMDTGDNAQAELIFERLLTQSPKFHGARLDFARVLVARQKYSAALEQLDQLAQTQPPQRAVTAIAQLRNVIGQRDRPKRWSRYLEASTALGYDSNVNRATVSDEFLGFALDTNSQEKDSDFLDYSVAGGVGYAFSRNLRMSGRLEYRQRNNAQASFVNSDALSFDTRLIRTTDTDFQQIKLVGYQFDIDGSRNSEGLALSGTWLRKLTPQWRVGIEGEVSQLDFSENLEVKDTSRFKAGVLGVYTLGDGGEGQLLLRAGAGTDDPSLSTSRYTRDFVYAGASVRWRFTPTATAALNMEYRNSQYDEIFFEQIYNEAREDDFYRVSGSLDWRFRPKWTLSHSLSYTLNDTFIDIFEYERFQVLLRLRYLFQ